MPIFWRLSRGLARKNLASARKYAFFLNNHQNTVYTRLPDFRLAAFHSSVYRFSALQPQKQTGKDTIPPLPLADSAATIGGISVKDKADKTAKEAEEQATSNQIVKPAESKPSIYERVKKEMLHYYHGFRLLGLDLKIASGLCFQVLRGHTLTRRERNQLVRTVADIFRLVPFAVFIIVPFMEFLLPVYIKLFPFMLPSTFKEQKTEDEKLKLRLVGKLKMAQFLQETISQTSLPAVNAQDNTPTLAEFSKFLKEVRTSGVIPQIEDIVKFSRLFEDQITLDSLDTHNLKALCQILDINTIGPANLLRLRLYMRVRQLKAQDQLIANEGVDQIPPFELQSLSRERGMRSLGLSEERLRQQLSQWLELHLNRKVPISLLLLSRAMYMHDATPAERLQKAISALPESVADEAELKVIQTAATQEVDTKAKIELLKREQANIKKERAEIKQQEKIAKAEILKDKAAEPSVDTAKTIHDQATDPSSAKTAEPVEKSFEPSATILGPELLKQVRAEEMLKELAGSDSQQLANVEKQIKEALEASQKTTISIQDLGTISKAISELESSKKDLHEEEIADIQEDLSEVTKKQAETQKTLVMATKSEEELKQNKAARQLASRVDKMLSEMNNLMTDLSKEKSTLLKDIELRQVMAKHENEASNRSRIQQTIEANRSRMIEVNQLLLALRKIQKVPDDTKWQRILEVLDEDKDGQIELKHVLSVIELMGTGNMKLEGKEMTRILDMLDNEQLLEQNAAKADKAPSDSTKPPTE